MEQLTTITPQELQLTTEEREHIRGQILAFIEEHPGRETPLPQQPPIVTRLRRRFMTSLSSLCRPLPAIGLASAILVLSGGGLAYAAEGSLPGEQLYKVKHLTEEVRSHLTFSEQAQADWEIAITERRLGEAEALQAQNRLTDSLHAELKKEFRQSIGRVNTHIKKLDQEGKHDIADKVAAKINDSLRTHQETVARFRVEE